MQLSLTHEGQSHLFLMLFDKLIFYCIIINNIKTRMILSFYIRCFETIIIKMFLMMMMMIISTCQWCLLNKRHYNINRPIMIRNFVVKESSLCVCVVQLVHICASNYGTFRLIDQSCHFMPDHGAPKTLYIFNPIYMSFHLDLFK